MESTCVPIIRQSYKKRFSRGIYHTPRDLAFGQILLRNCLPIFECQISCDLETAYHSLRSLYQDVWDAERYLKPKLRYYNLFKPDLSQEEYLSLNIPKYQRPLFAQFRDGVLPLQVEIGGFRKIPLEERLCNLCDIGQVKDEFHFLCICTNYSDLREALYIKAARVFPAFRELDGLENLSMC